MYNPYLQYRPTYAAGAQEMPVPQPYYGIKGRPVASIEEARAQTIDFDGSIFYFPDLANGKIYTKQINMDGTSTLNVYEIKEVPVATTEIDYITRSEFEQAMAALKDSLTPVQAPAKPAAATLPPINF